MFFSDRKPPSESVAYKAIKKGDVITLQMLAHIGNVIYVQIVNEDVEYDDDGVQDAWLLPCVQRTLDNINKSSLQFEQKVQLAVEYCYVLSALPTPELWACAALEIDENAFSN